MSIKLIKAFGFIQQLIVVIFAMSGFEKITGSTEWYFKVVFGVLMWAMIDFGCDFQRVKKVTDL